MAKSVTRRSANSPNQLATNRRARFDFEVKETFEAGLALVGTEVKSIRGGHVNIGEAYARFLNGELWLYNSNIGPYAPAGENHDPMRSRKLLLHRKELIRMQRALNEAPRATVVPLRLYLKRGFIKIEVGVAIGKRKYDKRQTIKKRDADREIRRALRHTSRD
jgi:SsrA-binding protein|tara:strand:- start:329 stop:817 length:489 start_codon:yes stop_codon:yes gene_type:complete